MKKTYAQETGGVGSNPNRIMYVVLVPENKGEKNTLDEIARKFPYNYNGKTTHRILNKGATLPYNLRNDYHDGEYPEYRFKNLNRVTHAQGIPQHAGYSECYSELQRVAGL